ncbi:benzoyl-CoA reductase [Oribacterium sp. C9]|uniref:2-hydroxyacyl-CoA dehydratase subunit D n=1 Tax=Oribacterium sp. C9 TaxID=1943579 RepID=UPI00098F622E|nr:2-hydroxyacyl-CoA dehydratase family protein [Oribacterium sp. C9]OON86702.1 benzoyl-CoA reductase [Oribacterium sp. C9]
MSVKEILGRFHEIAADPKAMKDKYLSEGREIVLVNYYTPEEIVHSMGAVPMGAWGADVKINEAKKYFPTFICSIVQSAVELGMKGEYAGAKAFIIPSLCDSLKVMGQNWKVAVPSIKFIPMTYPQNRKPEYGAQFTKAGYERVISELEELGLPRFSDEKLKASLSVYEEHNRVMNEVSELMASHPEISNQERSDVFKSAFFMLKEEHTALVKELINALKEQKPGTDKLKIMTSGIICDAPDILKILDENGLQIVCDDVCTETRQYRASYKEKATALDSLVSKFCDMDQDTLLYDADKTRIDYIVEKAKKTGAKGVLLLLTKFCDPEEFDAPMIRKACEKAGLSVNIIEIDRQMVNYEQARTSIETFRDLLNG